MEPQAVVGRRSRSPHGLLGREGCSGASLLLPGGYWDGSPRLRRAVLAVPLVAPRAAASPWEFLQQTGGPPWGWSTASPLSSAGAQCSKGGLGRGAAWSSLRAGASPAGSQVFPRSGTRLRCGVRKVRSCFGRVVLAQRLVVPCSWSCAGRRSRSKKRCAAAALPAHPSCLFPSPGAGLPSGTTRSLATSAPWSWRGSETPSPPSIPSAPRRRSEVPGRCCPV